METLKHVYNFWPAIQIWKWRIGTKNGCVATSHMT